MKDNMIRYKYVSKKIEKYDLKKMIKYGQKPDVDSNCISQARCFNL